MPTIHRLSNHKVKVCMYADDEAPPHFHLQGPGWSAKIALGSWEVLRGAPDPKFLWEARTWAKANEALLKDTWERLNERDD